ncbi:MAG: methionine--tRNA ligase [Candidatus Thermoplasmatota archaeon]|nr:methionine--tRNA ligase [Candidatus Thermoplasmatota archaeon]
MQYRYERARGRRVLMCSGSDEHGTPITITAEELGVSPQEVVDKYHDLALKSLIQLGCSWADNIDSRGVEYGGALYNRTSDVRHKEIVRDVFTRLLESDLLVKKTMKQYCSVSDGIVRFLPDRYVEGTCPICSEDGARGDQCDECGSTYEAHELINPISKLDPDSTIEIRDTEHLFFKLDLFQTSLEEHAKLRQDTWKPNVRSMTKNWLNMGLRPRAVTRDIDWGIELPLSGNEWSSKRVYVWFEAVQGYYTCARIWAERFASENNHQDGDSAWERWWKADENGKSPRHIYFMGKDNIPFHTVIWPSLIMGMNASDNDGQITHENLPGSLVLETNVSSNEYLMLQGGQFSKSRKHAVWLPSFLDRYDPDCLRYYLTINMPETHDTDFRWEDFVERTNNELIGTYGNFVHRVMTLTHRLTNEGKNPLSRYDSHEEFNHEIESCQKLLNSAMESMERQRFKEALRSLMGIAQIGNQVLQRATPWKYLQSEESVDKEKSLSALAFSWRLCRTLAICTRPFMPFQSDRLWKMLGENIELNNLLWDNSLDLTSHLCWNDELPEPLFKRLDLDEIISHELSLANDNNDDPVEGDSKGADYIEFEDFMKVEMKTGKVISVEDHPNADKLYVVTIQDTPGTTRTVCAGLKEYYEPSDLVGLNVVFVANLEPKKLRGVMSEGMLLAADDGDGNVSIVTTVDDIGSGSRVR